MKLIVKEAVWPGALPHGKGTLGCSGPRPDAGRALFVQALGRLYSSVPAGRNSSPAAFLTCNLSPWDPSSLCRSSWGLVRATAHRRQKAATGTSWWPPGFHSVTRCSPMARTDFCPTDRGPARRHTSGPTSENRAFTKSRVRSCSYSFQLSSRWSGCHKNGISQTPYERKKKRKATLRETLLLSRQTCCR